MKLWGGRFRKEENQMMEDFNSNPSQNQQRTSITSEEVQINNEADFNKAGVYEITYQMTDDSGKESVTGQVRLIVVVR